MHDREAMRPSSTGHLIRRVIPSSVQHIFRSERSISPEEIIEPGRELWILHPLGEELPSERKPENVQVLLLDGTWRQSTIMLRKVETMGRRVRLPMTGESRYWLRSHQGGDRFSTMEALLALLHALGVQETHDALRLQFELHVYAGLWTRGLKEDALRYLENSPLPAAFPELLRKLTPREVRLPWELS